jgi:aminopeptidase N
VLHALRQVVGDDVFFELLREWVAEYGGAAAVTADFVDLASDVAGCDLRPFFDEWLLADDAPDHYPGNGAGYCDA